MAETIRINENTWRIEDDGVRFFLLCGKEKAALIDTGMNTKNARAIAEGLTSLPTILVNTHGDVDHIAGNGDFDACYMSAAEERNYRNNGGSTALIPVSEGDVIDLGGRELLIIDIPGHTPGSIAILDVQNRVLISGDTVQDAHIFMFGEARDLNRYIESLKHLAEYDGRYDAVYPMHGTFPVLPDLRAKLLEGAQSIVDKKASGKVVEVFGTKVYLYRFDYAAFLCDLPEG